MLFDPRAHEPLAGEPWSTAGAEVAIRAIARDAEDALRDGAWWPVHPLDQEDGDPDAFHGIYLGAAGVLWALDRLARAGLHEPRLDHARLARDVLDAYLSAPELGGVKPSLWMGEGGIALIAWLLGPEAALADRLAELVAREPHGDTLELMWGSPGLLLIAQVMHERTGEERWAAAASAIADRLLAAQDAHGLWTQPLYGATHQYLGPAHGFAGNLAVLARHCGGAVPGALTALRETAVVEDGLANWPPTRDLPLAGPDGVIRTQWCHGAPGIVTSLCALPPDDELDAILLAGGELTWTAGPLRKGPGLCHGTAGNGFALLKLFTRTGDERWLDRARRFATHAAVKVQGRHTLWTGDLGTAIYLQQCLAATSDLPALDAW